MKTNRFFIGAIVLLTFLSCHKEEPQYRNIEELQLGEIITCSFDGNDGDTKTLKPSKGGNIWQSGDEIMLYDGVSNFQKLTLASSGDASSTTGVIKQDASKFTFIKPSGWTNVYAIYPYGACVSEFSASAPKLNFTDQDGTFSKANISAAVEVSGSMAFKNVGAILYHVRKPAAENATNIVVPVAELANDFQLSFTEGMPTLTPVSASHSNSFDINVSDNSIYIGVPAGCTIPKGSVFLYRTSTKAIINSYITGSSNTTARNTIYTLPEITAAGKLPGVFSVGPSEDNKVRFSKGNLYWNGSTWQLESNQYDYPSDWDENHVGHFFWTKTVAASYAENYDDGDCSATDNLFCDGSDAAHTLTIDGQSRLYALSKPEWDYLIKTRTNASNLIKKGVSVAGKSNCLIIAPDGYEGTIDTSYDATGWTAAESQGLVCLPLAGYRDGSSVESVNGYYWSSTTYDEEFVYDLYFNSDDVDTEDHSNSRGTAFPLRLVYSAQ